jgi:hypothetical protein
MMNNQNVAKALGWFSIGLGVAELFATDHVSRYFGMEKNKQLLRFYGIREIASGVVILSQKDPSAGLWSRVGGDLIDLATIGYVMKQNGEKRGRLGFAAAAIAGVTLLDAMTSRGVIRDRKSVSQFREMVSV